MGESYVVTFRQKDVGRICLSDSPALVTVLNLPPITEAVDVVVRSSSDDRAHCFTGSLPEGYDLVTATEITDTGANARGWRSKLSRLKKA